MLLLKERISLLELNINEINVHNKKEVKKSTYKNVLNFFNNREMKENEEYDKNNSLNQEMVLLLILLLV